MNRQTWNSGIYYAFGNWLIFKAFYAVRTIIIIDMHVNKQ